MERTLSTLHADDRDLALRAAGGDRTAFGTIYARYVDRVQTLLARRLPDVPDRDDLLQEVFLQVHRNLAQFRGGSALYTWIYRITCNVCIQWRRAQYRRRRAMALDSVPLRVLSRRPADADHAPDRVSDRRRLLASALDAVKALPVAERLVMALGPIQGFSYGQIASALGVSVDVVKGRMHRGRARLRREVDPRELVA